MSHTITLETPIAESPRVAQLRGLFDLPAERTSRVEWRVDLPLAERAWNVGLITGPSGCGKSTIARHLWPSEYARGESMQWPADRALVDVFPPSLSIKEVTALLSSVGFSSPPAWLRPYAILSTGQRFRAMLARSLAEAIAERHDLIVQDEFTSVVDRTVAQIGSAALARTVRNHNLRFIAVSCHDDIVEWLQPDWVYHPATGAFTWRSLRRRPRVVLEVSRCDKSEWQLFAPHHYLNHALAPSAVCLLVRWHGRPVAFSAWLPFVGAGKPARREHRTVALPDYQGVGVGRALSDLAASAWRGLGYRALSTTTHPALIEARQRSPHWVMRRAPSLAPGNEHSLRHATTRLTAGFVYTGPALPRRLAQLLVG